MTAYYHLRRLCVSNKRGPVNFPPPALPRPFVFLVGRGAPNSLPSQSSESSSEATFVLVGAEAGRAEAWRAEGCGGGLGAVGSGGDDDCESDEAL